MKSSSEKIALPERLRRKKKQSTPGRLFEGSDHRVGTYFTVSFKYEDTPIYRQVQRIAKEGSIAASEVLVDSVRLRFGERDLQLCREIILQRYVERELIGPPLFKTFDDIMEWELRNTEHDDIQIRWAVSSQIFSCLLYLYGMSQRKKQREYVKSC